MNSNTIDTRIIKVKIHEESDLYSPFDPDQKLLSKDVISYFTDNYINVHRKFREKYQVNIISDTPVNEENVKNSFFEYCTLEKDNIGFKLNKLIRKAMLLIAIGVILLSLWFFLSANMKGISVEVLSVLCWITLWEGAHILILERPELRHLQIIYERMSKAEIIIDIPKGNEDRKNSVRY